MMSGTKYPSMVWLAALCGAAAFVVVTYGPLPIVPCVILAYYYWRLGILGDKFTKREITTMLVLVGAATVPFVVFTYDIHVFYVIVIAWAASLFVSLAISHRQKIEMVN